MLWRQTGPAEAGRFHEKELKICHLCGALNLARNRECFVCGWHGLFDRRPEAIRLAMETITRKHGGLAMDMLTDISVNSPVVRVPLLLRLQNLFVRARRWLFG
jgi:ribosomal protein L40E